MKINAMFEICIQLCAILILGSFFLGWDMLGENNYFYYVRSTIIVFLLLLDQAIKKNSMDTCRVLIFILAAISSSAFVHWLFLLLSLLFPLLTIILFFYQRKGYGFFMRIYPASFVFFASWNNLTLASAV